jgi:molybdate transport system substrate-binding protein
MPARRGISVLFLAAAATLFAPRASAQDLTIVAASDLQSVFPVVAERFQKETGHAAKLTFGSSGNFYAQIQNGAPFDLFFSADIEYPKKLEAAGLTEPGTLYRYATGKIVLWARKGSGIDVERGLAVLADPGVHKIAIANPAHAPYGRAGVAALEHEKLYDRVSDKVVMGENISQTAQFVESGNADAGILALSLALAPKLQSEGKYYVIPASFYPPIDQGAVLLKSSQNKEAARAFLAFLKTPEIVSLLRDFGFIIPEQESDRKPEKR